MQRHTYETLLEGRGRRKLPHSRCVLRLAVALFLTSCSSGPSRGPCNPHPAPGSLGTICGFHNPEDVEAIASHDVLLVSQMRPIRGGGQGSLAALTLSSVTTEQPFIHRLWPPPDGVPTEPLPPAKQAGFWGDPACTEPPAPDEIAPHGITSGHGETPDTARIAVVSHQPREAIELFELSGQGSGAILRWRGCVPLPENAAANDVAIAPNGDIVVGNYMPTFSGIWPLFYMVAGGLGMNTGDVILWGPARGWRHVPGTGARSANGIAVSPDGSRIYYAETGAKRISMVPREGAADGKGLVQAPVAGSPDNFSWSSKGRLLTAIHMDSLGFLRCAFGKLPCRAPWRLIEIDPESLAATTLHDDPGSDLGAVASASEWNGRTFLGAVFDDRIGLLEPAR